MKRLEKMKHEVGPYAPNPEGTINRIAGGKRSPFTREAGGDG